MKNRYKNAINVSKPPKFESFHGHLVFEFSFLVHTLFIKVVNKKRLNGNGMCNISYMLVRR